MTGRSALARTGRAHKQTTNQAYSKHSLRSLTHKQTHNPKQLTNAFDVTTQYVKLNDAGKRPAITRENVMDTLVVYTLLAGMFICVAIIVITTFAIPT